MCLPVFTFGQAVQALPLCDKPLFLLCSWLFGGVGTLALMRRSLSFFWPLKAVRGGLGNTSLIYGSSKAIDLPCLDWRFEIHGSLGSFDGKYWSLTDPV